jgi:hypothetical protein
MSSSTNPTPKASADSYWSRTIAAGTEERDRAKRATEQEREEREARTRQTRIEGEAIIAKYVVPDLLDLRNTLSKTHKHLKLSYSVPPSNSKQEHVPEATLSIQRSDHVGLKVVSFTLTLHDAGPAVADLNVQLPNKMGRGPQTSTKRPRAEIDQAFVRAQLTDLLKLADIPVGD